jgi:hypothetical protein
MRKKILLIESLMHFWQISDLYKLFSKDFDCEILLPKKYRHLIDVKKNVIVSPLKYFIFLHAILIGRKYDFIYLVTSPEYPEYPKNLKSFLEYFQQLFVYLLLIIFFRKKIILYVRGIYRVVPEINLSKKKFYIQFRKMLFLLVNRFVCENKNLENVFKQKFIKEKKNYFVSTLYTRFFDPNKNFKKKISNDFLTIGILGAIDPLRKDYNLINNFVKNNKSKIKLIFLGRRYKNLSDEVVNNFSKFNTIIKDYLTDEDFEKLGSQCDVLLSLNKEDKMYGSFKGTGSYGDALKLQKRLIAPKSSDSVREFEDFSLYYSNQEDLEDILNKLLNSRSYLEPDFSNFSIEKIRSKFLYDLKLY